MRPARKRRELSLPTTCLDERPLRILLVEDYATNLLLVTTYLKSTPYLVELAEHGAQALERIQAAPFDLILMDMEMPVMDGYTATRAIREWERAQRRPRTPIVALTAHALDEYEQKSHQAGCDALLAKPITRAQLLAAIHQHARVTDATATGDGSESTAAPASARVVIQADPTIVDLIPLFLTDMRAAVKVIQAALTAGDFKKIQRIGHGMKGTGAAYGFEEVSALGRRLERAAQAGQQEKIVHYLAELSAYLDRVRVSA